MLGNIKICLLSLPKNDIAHDILSLVNMLKNGNHSEEIKKRSANGTCTTINELLELLQALPETTQEVDTKNVNPHVNPRMDSIKQVQKILAVVHTGKRSGKPPPANRFVKEITGIRLRFAEDHKKQCKMLENPIEEWLGYVPVFDDNNVRLLFQWNLPEESNSVPDEVCTTHTTKKQKISVTDEIGDRVEQVPATIVSEPKTDSAVCVCLNFDDGVTRQLQLGTKIYIGRTARPDTEASSCHVFTDEVDKVWRKVSALHCNITNEVDGVKLLDTSTNGTWVNGEKIKKNTAITLKHGDKVKLYHAKGEETVASAKFTVWLPRAPNA